MYRLFIHADAESDLERLWETEPEAAARITVLLEAIEADQRQLDQLTEHGFGTDGAGAFNVSKWHRQWNLGHDLWRLKAWDLEKVRMRYRVVYAFVPGKRHYHVLAVLPRAEVNYDDPNDPITGRILRAYADL